MELSDKEIRRRWKEWCKDSTAFKGFPEEFRTLTCGAKTRAGTPCKQKGLYESSRCKLHGGLSTGPRTNEGKKKSALNGLIKKAKSRGTKPHEENLKKA